MSHHVRGKAISMARIMRLIKFFERSTVTLTTDAPRILRMTISLVRDSALKAASPESPRQEMRMANPAKYRERIDTLCSETYNDWKASSRNLYSNTKPGLNRLYSSPILESVSFSLPAPILAITSEV